VLTLVDEVLHELKLAFDDGFLSRFFLMGFKLIGFTRLATLIRAH
jgi:hypothetical protein